jgi:hypothetical protein
MDKEVQEKVLVPGTHYHHHHHYTFSLAVKHKNNNHIINNLCNGSNINQKL